MVAGVINPLMDEGKKSLTYVHAEARLCTFLSFRLRKTSHPLSLSFTRLLIPSVDETSVVARFAELVRGGACERNDGSRIEYHCRPSLL